MKTMVRTNNQAKVIGRVTKVNEFGKDVADITVALDNGKDKEGNDIQSTFVTFKCFEPKVYGAIETGLLVRVYAHFSNNKYENKAGETVYSTDFVTDSVEFLESKAVVDARKAAKAE